MCCINKIVLKNLKNMFWITLMWWCVVKSQNYPSGGPNSMRIFTEKGEFASCSKFQKRRISKCVRVKWDITQSQEKKMLGSVGVEGGHARNSEKFNFTICLGEMGHVPVSQKNEFPKFQVCSGRTWPCVDVKKGECPTLLWQGHFQIQKMWFTRSVWKDMKLEHVWIPGKVDFQNCWSGNWKCPLGGEIDHVWLWNPQKANFLVRVGDMGRVRLYFHVCSSVSGIRKKRIVTTVVTELGHARILEKETLTLGHVASGGAAARHAANQSPESPSRTVSFHILWVEPLVCLFLTKKLVFEKKTCWAGSTPILEKFIELRRLNSSVFEKIIGMIYRGKRCCEIRKS